MLSFVFVFSNEKKSELDDGKGECLSFCPSCRCSRQSIYIRSLEFYGQEEGLPT